MRNDLIIQNLVKELSNPENEKLGFRRTFTFFVLHNNTAELSDESLVSNIIIQIHPYGDYEDDFDYGYVGNRILELIAGMLKNEVLNFDDYESEYQENYRYSFKGFRKQLVDLKVDETCEYWATITNTDYHIIVNQINYPQ